MGSKHAASVPLLLKDIHHLLIEELDLPTPFTSADPEVAEAYGLLSAQSLRQIDTNTMQLDCTFIASSAFATYWEAATWAIATAMNLDHLLPLVKTKIQTRKLLLDFDKTSSIAVGRPRAPLKAVNSQKSHIFIVDVVMPCAIKLLITRDVVCGHI